MHNNKHGMPWDDYTVGGAAVVIAWQSMAHAIWDQTSKNKSLVIVILDKLNTFHGLKPLHNMERRKNQQIYFIK